MASVKVVLVAAVGRKGPLRPLPALVRTLVPSQKLLAVCASLAESNVFGSTTDIYTPVCSSIYKLPGSERSSRKQRDDPPRACEENDTI